VGASSCNRARHTAVRSRRLVNLIETVPGLELRPCGHATHACAGMPHPSQK
jgi:hypothetical protein